MDLAELRALSPAAVIDKITGYSTWTRAEAEQGRLPVLWQLDVRGMISVPEGSPLDEPRPPRYDEATLRPLIEALQTGAVALKVLDAHTHQWITLPSAFWFGGWRLEADGPQRDAWTLQAYLRGGPIGPAYIRPEFVIPELGTPQQLAWKFAEDILSTPDAPPRDRHRASALARLVHPKLTAAGHSVLVETVASYIRGSLSDWEKKNPTR